MIQIHRYRDQPFTSSLHPQVYTYNVSIAVAASHPSSSYIVSILTILSNITNVVIFPIVAATAAAAPHICCFGSPHSLL